VQRIGDRKEYLAENSRDEQRKIIRYGHLLANLVIFMNVYDQTRILRDLVQEGYRVTPKILASLSPYRTAHLNPFWELPFEDEKRNAPTRLRR
jgi:hypothetical protein